MNVTALMKRIETAKADLSHSKGQQEAIQGEIDTTVKKLRKALGCKAGGEKAAMKALRAKLEAEKEELEGLLDEIETVKEGANEDASDE